MEMVNSEKINELRKIIDDSLIPIIDDDYVLLDIPDHCNIGDQAIWSGEIEFLKKINYKNKLSAPFYSIDFEKISESDVILCHGGGNFGDLWAGPQELREKIVLNFRKNKIIVFPQTMYFRSQKNLEKSASIFNSHGNVTICARDNKTYKLMKKYFIACDVLLVPDMAFCLNFEDHLSTNISGKSLFVKRTDKELNDIRYDTLKVEDLTISDWPTYMPDFHKLTQHNSELKKSLFSNLLFKLALKIPLLMRLYYRGISSVENRRSVYMNIGIDFLNQYDCIYSTRLHCIILGLLLNKNVYVYDNSYGKNSSFYDTWLSNFENCVLMSRYDDKQ